MSIIGYQSDVPQNGVLQASRNSVKLSQVLPEHLSPTLVQSPSTNRYSLINENMVIGKDLRFRPNSSELEIIGWQLSLPAPLVLDETDYTGTLLSIEGRPFYYKIDIDGRVFVNGTLASEEDEVILNINPYLAELPLRFRTFAEIPNDSTFGEQKPITEF